MFFSNILDCGFVGDRGDSFGFVFFDGDGLCFVGKGGLFFELNGFVFGFGFFFEFGVFFYVVKEIFVGVGGLDVFDMDVEVFFDVVVFDFFVDDDVDGGFGDVVDDVSFVVVDFVGYIVCVKLVFNFVYSFVWCVYYVVIFFLKFWKLVM